MVLLWSTLRGTDTVAVNCRMATQPSDVICSPGPGDQYSSAKRLTNRRFAASVSVERCSTAGPSPRSSAA
eukprot:5512886-Prymnesium_polylepis.1